MAHVHTRNSESWPRQPIYLALEVWSQLPADNMPNYKNWKIYNKSEAALDLRAEVTYDLLSCLFSS